MRSHRLIIVDRHVDATLLTLDRAVFLNTYNLRVLGETVGVLQPTRNETQCAAATQRGWRFPSFKVDIDRSSLCSSRSLLDWQHERISEARELPIQVVATPKEDARRSGARPRLRRPVGPGGLHRGLSCLARRGGRRRGDLAQAGFLRRETLGLHEEPVAGAIAIGLALKSEKFDLRECPCFNGFGGSGERRG